MSGQNLRLEFRCLGSSLRWNGIKISRIDEDLTV
jgi:hypothetical protein